MMRNVVRNEVRIDVKNEDGEMYTSNNDMDLGEDLLPM